MKMLLKRGDVNPNAANHAGETPLSTAACDGYWGVVKKLLERPDINPNMANRAGETARSQALKSGHHAIAKLLSEHRNFIPTLIGDEFTALSPYEPSDLDHVCTWKIRRH